MAEFNIVGPCFEPLTDLKLFYTDEELTTNRLDVPLTPLLESDKTMAHLLVRLGNIPVSTGWTTFNIGKAKNRMDLFIWNPKFSMSEWMIHHESEESIVEYFTVLHSKPPYTMFSTWVGSNPGHITRIRDDLRFSQGVDIINNDKPNWRVGHSYRWLK
jgi:hypothetical protein